MGVLGYREAARREFKPSIAFFDFSAFCGRTRAAHRLLAGWRGGMKLSPFDPNQRVAAVFTVTGQSLKVRGVRCPRTMSASSRPCSAPTDTRSSACSGELTSVMRKVPGKPQNLPPERSKPSTDVLG